MLYLKSAQQHAELERIIATKEDRERRAKVAAQVIREYIRAGKRDLVALRKDLQLALSSSRTPTHA
jgi:hypothetical protein